MEFLIITGLSGAGKSRAADVLEDLDYYCVDNMPVALMPRFAELCLDAHGRYDKVALVTDVRERDGFGELLSTLDELKAMEGCTVRILYMDADLRTLVRRYKESRRPHPLAGKGVTLEQAVAREEALLAPIKARADVVLNSSQLTLGQLKSRMFSLFAAAGQKQELQVTAMSFGYKHGLPMDADLVFDVRFLPNPFYVENLRPLSGLDKPVGYFTVSENKVAAGVNSHRYLIFERMEKQFPNRVTLYVHERTPIARVQDMGTEFVLDEEGMVLENFAVGKEDAYDGLMFITGLKPKDMRVGQIMQAGTVVQTEAFKALVREVILQGITDEISELNLADPENLYLITVDQYTAHLGNAENLRAKIGTVRAVTAYLRSEGYHGGMMEANIPGEVIYSPLSP